MYTLWRPHSAFIFRSVFFFLNLSLIRKYIGNNSWQDLTGVCFIFTFYTLTCSGSNLVLLLFHLSWIESCRYIDKYSVNVNTSYLLRTDPMLQLLGIRQGFYQVSASALSIRALRVVSVSWCLFVLKSINVRVKD